MRFTVKRALALMAALVLTFGAVSAASAGDTIGVGGSTTNYIKLTVTDNGQNLNGLNAFGYGDPPPGVNECDYHVNGTTYWANTPNVLKVESTSRWEIDMKIKAAKTPEINRLGVVSLTAGTPTGTSSSSRTTSRYSDPRDGRPRRAVSNPASL